MNSILRVYANRKEKAIKEEMNIKIDEALKNNETYNAYMKLKSEFKDAIRELYLNQDQANKVLKDTEIKWNFRYKLIDGFTTEEVEEIKKEYKEKLNELNDLVVEVQAMLDICDTKEEIEDVLVTYNIIDKKTKRIV